MNRIWSALFFVFINLLSAKAQSTLLLDDDKKSEFGKYIYYFIDSTNKLQLKDITRLNRSFLSSQEDVFFHLPTMNNYWIKLKVKNTSNKEYYLLVDNPHIKELEVYIIQNNKETILAKTGTNLSFLSRNILKNNFVFRLNLPLNEKTVLYLKYNSTRGELPLVIATAPKLMELFQTKDLLWGIYFGILLALIIYNLFISITIKDRSYLFQISFFFLIGIYTANLFGYSFQYFFPNHPKWNELTYSISAVSIIFAILFGIDFLNLRKNAPGLYNVALVFIALFLVEAIINFSNELIASIADAVLKISLTPFLAIIGFVLYRRGFTPARYYLIASAFLLIAALINNFRLMGYISTNDITMHIVYFGLVIDAVLYSLALGDRYNINRKEKEKIQNELNNELKSKIEERAKNQNELEKLNKHLKQTNSDLDNFIYTASHDLKGPITNIEGIMNLLNSKETDKETKDLYSMIFASTSKFKDTVSDLTEVSRIQQIREDNEEIIYVQNLIDEVVHSHNDDFKKFNITIHFDLKKHPQLRFSKKNLKRILENLISNSIRFHSPKRNPEIFISADENNDYYILSIKDNGLGIKRDYHKKVFSIFKKAHTLDSGRGVGLYRVKRIIENKGGTIELESEEDKGSTFTLYFKKGVQHFNS